MSEMENKGRVIWITGLSGAGKTTVARALKKEMPGAILLDGDELREVMDAASARFDKESRKKLAASYGRLAGLLAGQGFTIIVATISLFHSQHDWNRKNLPGYLEVFMDAPEEVRRKRDPKGLYAKQAQGQVTQMAGASDLNVEFPLNPDLRFDDSHTPEECRDAIISRLQDCAAG